MRKVSSFEKDQTLEVDSVDLTEEKEIHPIIFNHRDTAFFGGQGQIEDRTSFPSISFEEASRDINIASQMANLNKFSDQ